MKMINNRTCRPHTSILLTVYRILIHSKLNYWAIIYKSITKTNLQLLNIMQSTRLRTATGVFLAISTNSLEIFCREPPIFTSHKILTNNYYTTNNKHERKHTTETNANPQILTSISISELHEINSTTNKLNSEFTNE